MKVYTQPMVRGRVDDMVFCVCGSLYYARRYVKPRLTEHNIALGKKVCIAMRLYKELTPDTMTRLQQYTDIQNKQEPYRSGKGITRSSAWLQLFFRFMDRHPELSWEDIKVADFRIGRQSIELVGQAANHMIVSDVLRVPASSSTGNSKAYPQQSHGKQQSQAYNNTKNKRIANFILIDI